MGSNKKASLLLGLLAAIFLLLSSEVAARIMAEIPTDKQTVASETEEVNNDAKIIGGQGFGFDPRYGGFPGFPGGGYGGYPYRGGYRGGYPYRGRGGYRGGYPYRGGFPGFGGP